MDRLAAANRNRKLTNTHIFHAHRFVPAKHLFIGVFGLILRGIPVKSIKHPSFRIGMPVHWKHMMDRARNRRSQQWHFSQSTPQVIKTRHRDLKHLVERFRPHFVGKAPPEITKAIPLVITAVQPHGEDAARFQVLREGLHSGLAIGSVMQNTDAVDDVKTFWGKG